MPEKAMACRPASSKQPRARFVLRPPGLIPTILTHMNQLAMLCIQFGKDMPQAHPAVSKTSLAFARMPTLLYHLGLAQVMAGDF